MLFCELLGCLVALLCIPLLLLPGLTGSIRRRLVDGPRVGRAGRPPVSKWGGIPLVASLIAVTVLAVCGYAEPGGDRTTGWIVLATSLGVFAVGLLDDFRLIGTKRRVILQALVAALACFLGVQVEVWSPPLTDITMNLGRLSGFLTLSWLVLMMVLFQRINSVNCLAGCLGLLAMGFIAHGVTGTSASGLIAVGAAGALVGFLVYNLPPTLIRLGSSGAGLVGYLCGILCITNPHRDHESAMLGVLTVALLGAAFATWRGAKTLLSGIGIRSKASSRLAPRFSSSRSRERR